MARFFGTYEHTLDAKGRVILPARFRAAFAEGGFLSQNTDGCLALRTPEEFERQMQEKESRESLSRSDRNQARLWASNTHEVEIDRQGRMAIPSRLREFAGLHENVFVTGVINRVELWDPSRWEERVGPEEQRLTEGLDD
ncbi:MAG: division/cell wall cluster transcriptional repressor MraZ [Acidimicrobiales bacterium]